MRADQRRENNQRDFFSPAVASVARHKGRVVEIIVDETASASNDQFPALETSADGGSNDGDNGTREVA